MLDDDLSKSRTAARAANASSAHFGTPSPANANPVPAVKVSARVRRLSLGEYPHGAGWGFFRDLCARWLSGVALVTSDAHGCLVDAIGATLPGASWQRCRTHYAANLMSATPRSSWLWVKALLHSIYDQPDADAVHAQFDRVVEALTDKLPDIATHLDDARADILAFTGSRKPSGVRSGPTIPKNA